MDIEIKNESQALTICGNAKSDKIKQLNSHISTLNSLINKIKVNWSSTGSDQSTYIAELEKQANNLQEISNQSYRFFDVIERYVDSTQKTSQNTVGGGTAGGTGGSGSTGAGVASGAAKAANAAANAIKNTANNISGAANGVGNKTGSTGTGTVSGGSSVTLDPGVPNSSIVGVTGVGGTTGGTGGTSTGGSSYTGGTGSTSGGGSSTISSVHGGGSAASSLNGTGTGTAGGETGSGASAGISAAAGTNGTVSTSASEIFTSDKLDGVVPKLSVPMSSGATSGSKAVPIVSGGVAAGAVGLGAAAILKKTPAAKPEKNLEIDAWEESKEVPVETEAVTMEQRLGELTFDDIIM